MKGSAALFSSSIVVNGRYGNSPSSHIHIMLFKMKMKTKLENSQRNAMLRIVASRVELGKSKLIISIVWNEEYCSDQSPLERKSWSNKSVRKERKVTSPEKA